MAKNGDLYNFEILVQFILQKIAIFKKSIKLIKNIFREIVFLDQVITLEYPLITRQYPLLSSQLQNVEIFLKFCSFNCLNIAIFQKLVKKYIRPISKTIFREIIFLDQLITPEYPLITRQYPPLSSQLQNVEIFLQFCSIYSDNQF